MDSFNYNILRTVLPFYPSVDHQNRIKSWCKDEMRAFSLITPQYRFIPFQIVRPPDPGTTYTWELWKVIDSDPDNDYLYMSITFPAGQIDTATSGGFDYITYFGSEDFYSPIDCGRYYIYWTDGVTEKFSEVFHIMDFDDDTTDIYRKYGDDSQLRLTDITDFRITK